MAEPRGPALGCGCGLRQRLRQGSRLTVRSAAPAHFATPSYRPKVWILNMTAGSPKTVPERALPHCVTFCDPIKEQPAPAENQSGLAEHPEEHLGQVAWHGIGFQSPGGNQTAAVGFWVKGLVGGNPRENENTARRPQNAFARPEIW
jgi:hypothetical protein